MVDGTNVEQEVHAVLERMGAFSTDVRAGRWTGLHGQTHPQRH